MKNPLKLWLRLVALVALVALMIGAWIAPLVITDAVITDVLSVIRLLARVS